jgi:RecB family exonuclease
MYKPRPNTRAAIRRVSPTTLDLYLKDRPAFDKRFGQLSIATSRLTPATMVGISVHRALQLAHETLSAKERTADALEALLREAWAGFPREAAFAKPATERWWGRRAVHMVRAYSDLPESQAEPMACEAPVSVLLPDGIEVAGQVDRVDRHADGLVVIDYKTGQEPITEKELRTTPAAWCYAAGVQARYRKPVVEVRWLYLGRRKAVLWRPDAGELQRATDQLGWLAREAISSSATRGRPRRAA